METRVCLGRLSDLFLIPDLDIKEEEFVPSYAQPGGGGGGGVQLKFFFTFFF